MNDFIERFEMVLATTPRRLVDISESAAAAKPEPAHWSKKEILGHLIDSAGNNHQRFVRAQFTPLLEIPSYEQEQWVQRQAYHTEPWPDLVNLWLLFNRHLLHIVKAMPPDVLDHQLVIAGRPAVPLSFVVTDYLHHLEHHLEQIFA